MAAKIKRRHDKQKLSVVSKGFCTPKYSPLVILWPVKEILRARARTPPRVSYLVNLCLSLGGKQQQPCSSSLVSRLLSLFFSFPLLPVRLCPCRLS
jgi:hypothetical protein